MMSIGHSREEILSFTGRFKRFLADQGIEADGAAKTDTVVGLVRQAIGGHFRTYPPGQERLHRLELVAKTKNS